MIEIQKYIRDDGVVPFDRWFNRIKDTRAQSRILIQLDRLKLGLPGDWKSVGGSVFELRIFEGKGYRVYFARQGSEVILLLCGGDKATQKSDIDVAKSYWSDFRSRR